jgi:hypothetical protein
MIQCAVEQSRAHFARLAYLPMTIFAHGPWVIMFRDQSNPNVEPAPSRAADKLAQAPADRVCP